MSGFFLQLSIADQYARTQPQEPYGPICWVDPEHPNASQCPVNPPDSSMQFGVDVFMPYGEIVKRLPNGRFMRYLTEEKKEDRKEAEEAARIRAEMKAEQDSEEGKKTKPVKPNKIRWREDMDRPFIFGIGSNLSVNAAGIRNGDVHLNFGLRGYEKRIYFAATGQMGVGSTDYGAPVAMGTFSNFTLGAQGFLGYALGKWEYSGPGRIVMIDAGPVVGLTASVKGYGLGEQQIAGGLFFLY